MTLTEFLLARIAEDEAPTFELLPYDCDPGCCAPAGWVGRRCFICDDGISYGGTVEAMTDIARQHEEQIHRRSRVLAECESKRRLIAEVHPGATDEDECPGCGATLGGEWLTPPGAVCPVLALLALPYADHEDFQEEWRA